MLNPNAGSETPIYDPEDQSAYKQVARLFASRPPGYIDQYCDRQQELKRKQERTIIENHYRFAADSVLKKLDAARKTRPALPVADFLLEYKQHRRSMTDDEEDDDTLSESDGAAGLDDDEPLQVSQAFATPQESSSSSSTSIGEVSSMLASSSLSSSSSSTARRSSLPAPSSSSVPPSPLARAALASSSSAEPSSPSSAPLSAQKDPSNPRPPSPLNLPSRSPKAVAASRAGLFNRKRPQCGWINQQAADFSLMYHQYES